MRFGQRCPTRGTTFTFGCSLGFLLILLGGFWLVRLSFLSLAGPQPFPNRLCFAVLWHSEVCPADAANNRAGLGQKMPGLTSKCSAKTCSQQMKVLELLLALVTAELSSSRECWALVLVAKEVLGSLGNLVISCGGGFWEKGGKLD